MQTPSKQTLFNRYILLVTAALLILSACTGTPPSTKTPLPFDPQVTKGELENGLTYFIRENSEPENRISLRLYVDAGSVLEDEDQEGIAHLLEHMAFNGSENFEAQELERFLESLGMEFGPDLNAYTSFDETVYQLEIPADDEETVEKAFLVLRDWATGLTLEEEAIDDERLVVQEEWRLRRGARARIRDKQIAALLKGSRYAERIPIGEMEDVLNTPAERIRDYYRKWYRPELMAVSVVGEIETDRAIELISENFSYPAPSNPAVRPRYEVPLKQEPEALVLSDPELTIGQVQIMTKLPPRKLTSREDYRRDIVEILFWNMLNSRLEERTKEEDPPFMRAGGSSYAYVRSLEVSFLTGRTRPDRILDGLEALLTEAKRINDHGFTISELDRERARILKAVENAYLERNNRESSSIAREIGDYFLENQGMPGIEYEWRLFQDLLPEITLAEVEALSGSFFPADERLITLSLPSGSEGAPVPREEEVLALHRRVMNSPTEPYADEQGADRLIEVLPPAGAITARERFDEIGTELLTLSNGMRVAFKKTDFQENRILLSGFSPGGESLIETAALPAARTAVLIQEESGLGAFNANQLEKFLADKDASLERYIGRSFEGFNGNASSGDLEYLLQLIHLTFTAPRFDEEAFRSVQTRIGTSVENRDRSPQTAFSDALTRLRTGNSPRRKPFTLETVAEMDLALSEEIYRERFASPEDFTLVFVGNLDTEGFLPLAEEYLASIPRGGGREEAVDRGIRPVETPVSETVFKGVEEQATVLLLHLSPATYSDEKAVVTGATASVVENVLGEEIREELGGTYSISTWGGLYRRPYEHHESGVYFGTDPGRVDELITAVDAVIGELASQGPEERFITNNIRAYQRSFEEQLEENSFWLNHIEVSLREEEDPEDLLTPEEYAAIINAEAIQRRIGEIFRLEDRIRVTLLPESAEDKSR